MKPSVTVAAINAGFVGLVIIAVLNSAISAVYYLRIVNACYFKTADNQADVVCKQNRVMVAVVGGALAIYLGLAGNQLAHITHDATRAYFFPNVSYKQLDMEVRELQSQVPTVTAMKHDMNQVTR